YSAGNKQMMDDRANDRDLPWEPVTHTNESGTSPFLFVCEHASNFIPGCYNGLGLKPHDLTTHIAWDPGALEVAQHLSKALDAPLITSCLSRLLIDCNRPLDAPDLIPE